MERCSSVLQQEAAVLTFQEFVNRVGALQGPKASCLQLRCRMC